MLILLKLRVSVEECIAPHTFAEEGDLSEEGGG